MPKNTLLNIVALFILCLTGALVWAHYSLVKPAFALSTSAPLGLSQLEEYYGIHFAYSPTDARKQPISAERAVSIVEKMYAKPVAVSVAYGYMTIDPHGNAVFVPQTTKAGQMDHGIVTDYPVWLVIRSNMPSFHSGHVLAPNVSARQRAERNDVVNTKASDYTFVDATNGQEFFTVTVANK